MLFIPIMSLISSALEEERELEAVSKKQKADLVDESRGKKDKGPVSLLHGPQNEGFARITTPSRNS